MTNKIYLFSNGTQYMDWRYANCCRCKKSVEVWGMPDDLPTCEIEYAIMFASIDDSTVSPEMAKRAGYNDDTKDCYNWTCSEVEWTDEWIAKFKGRQTT